MPLTDDIAALVEKMPELDVTPAPPASQPDGKPAPKPEIDPRHFKGKLTGPRWEAAAKIYDAVLSRPGGVGALIDLVKENDFGPAYKARYVLHGLTVYVCRPGKESQRAAVRSALLAGLGGNRPKSIKAALIHMLRVCGDASVVPALAPMLADPELCDAAAAAMVTLGGNAGDLLRGALATQDRRCRLAIIQGLGYAKNAAAVDTLIAATNDADSDVKVTALWALARIADPRAVAVTLKVADESEGWLKTQATKSAIQLTENLVAAGRKGDAVRIYRHLIETRKDPKEQYIRETAQRAMEAMD